MTASPAEIEEFAAFAAKLADASGAAIRPHFRQPIAIDTKPDQTPVTIADRDAEKTLRRLIEATYPDHGILGEEFGAVRREARFVWALDPIDGTKSFITGTPMFGTLIALCERGRPIVGVIDQPVARERWIGIKDVATCFNGAATRTRACGRLDRAVLFTTGLSYYPPAALVMFERLAARVNFTRFSGDCYAFGLLALGFVDLVVECSLKDHDFAALGPIVEGAGGVITDWQGRPLALGSDGRVLAAGDPALHREALAILAG
ncbi:MAG: histidinol-phosphatase [Alphaproteobacteria bacterium]|nr:histidinol-phosphatase [Alphaproteobacteria bacterium]